MLTWPRSVAIKTLLRHQHAEQQEDVHDRLPSTTVPSRVRDTPFQVLHAIMRFLALASAIATLANPSLK